MQQYERVTTLCDIWDESGAIEHDGAPSRLVREKFECCDLALQFFVVIADQAHTPARRQGFDDRARAGTVEKAAAVCDRSALPPAHNEAEGIEVRCGLGRFGRS